MTFKIPKEFQLMGQTIKVVWDDELIQKSDRVGEARYRESEIALQPDLKGFIRKQTQIDQSFFHELLHFIFNVLGESELRENEKLIEQVSGLLHQAIRTMK